MTTGQAVHGNIGCWPSVLARSVAAAALLAILCVSRAAAQPPAEAVRAHLSVQADASCATSAELVERVRKRSQRISFESDQGDIPRVLVVIRAGADDDRVAELTLQWPDGRRSERSVRASSCAAALDALALLVAMTLDPAALDGAATEPASQSAQGATGAAGAAGAAGATGATGSPSTTEPDPATSESDPSSAAQPTEAAQAQATEAPKNAEPTEPTEPAPEQSADPSSAVSFFAVEHAAFGLSAQLEHGAAPRAMPGFGLYALLALQGTGAWAPAASLELLRAWAFELSQTGGEADFELQAAKLDACPLGLRLGPFAARACAAVVLGRLLAGGAHTYGPQEHEKLWASLGGTLLFTLGIGSVLELRAGLGVARPLTRYDFAFRPDVFHRVPGVSLDGHLGAGVRFR